MPQTNVRPGKGYEVREHLGSGRWKDVYRAVQRRDWRDVALLRFKDTPSIEKLLAELRPLQALQGKRAENIAQLYGAFKGDDDHTYLVQELMYRSLDNISPLGNIARFIEIARGLFGGLAEFHELGLVHKDIKLENCGIDFLERAKLFDLGSGSSDSSHSLGSVLTRAPELFQGGSVSYTTQADVWALGATLLALRSGRYPFASSSDWKNRPPADKKGQPSRAHFEKLVCERALKKTAGDGVSSLIADAFPDQLKSIMDRLLSFSPTNRPTARDARDEWARLLEDWFSPSTPRLENEDTAVVLELEQYLDNVAKRRIGMSPRQWNLTLETFTGLSLAKGGQVVTKVSELMEKVRELRVAGTLS